MIPKRLSGFELPEFGAFMQQFAFFENLAYSLQCFTGKKVLHETSSYFKSQLVSASPVELKTYPSGQGCGTVTYHVSHIDSTFQRQGASAVQGFCVNYDTRKMSLAHCQALRTNHGTQFTINSCQVNFSFKVNSYSCLSEIQFCSPLLFLFHFAQCLFVCLFFSLFCFFLFLLVFEFFL